MSKAFYNKCCKLGDYISFIQPISMLNNTTSMYQFDLIHSEDLGRCVYTDRELHCCLNIYRRPLNGELNKPKKLKLQDVRIVEYRRGRHSADYIEPNYDYGFCSFGSVGIETEYVGQYASELYLYINPKFKDSVIECLEYNKLNEYVKSVSTKRLSIQGLCRYLLDNVEGLS